MRVFTYFLYFTFLSTAHSNNLTPEQQLLVKEAIAKIEARNEQRNEYLKELTDIRDKAYQREMDFKNLQSPNEHPPLIAKIEITPTWLNWARDNRKGQFQDYLIKYDILLSSQNNDVMNFFKRKIGEGWFIERSESNFNSLPIPIKQPVTMKVRMIKPTTY